MESAELPQAAFDFWPLLSQWLGQNWPWLCLLGAVALAFIFRDWLLEQPAGRFWIVPAALLPASIPFARGWDQQAPAPFKGLIVPALLVAVAGLQLYGQERNGRISDRNRKNGENEVNRIGAGVDSIGAEVDSIGAEIKQQGIVLRSIADTVEQQGIRINRIGADLRCIADGIGTIASQEEETEGEDEMEDRDD